MDCRANEEEVVGGGGGNIYVHSREESGWKLYTQRPFNGSMAD